MDNYDHFRLLDEPVVIPPFLVRDVSAPHLVKHLKGRVAREGITIKEPKKTTAQNGMAAIGLSIEQQTALVDSLTGRYAEIHWGDMREGLTLLYPVNLIDALYGDRVLPAYEVRRLVQTTLAIDTGAETQRALDFLYRSWEVRQQVIVEGRPLSLIPIVGGDLQSDTPSFTPVVTRLDDGRWRVGWEGDLAKVSPLILDETDPAQAMSHAFEVYTDWYEKDKRVVTEKLRNMKNKMDFLGHLYVPVWGYILRSGTVSFGTQGEVTMENISHNRLFRLRFIGEFGAMQRVIFSASVEEGILMAIAAAGGQIGTTPDAKTVQEAYSALLGVRGSPARIEQVPCQDRNALPIDTRALLECYRITGTTTGTITVAWVNHPKAAAVVSGVGNKTRAMMLVKEKSLGVFPVTPKTRNPDIGDIWQTTITAGLDWQRDTLAKEAVSLWLAWLWHKKSGQKRYLV